VSWILADPWDRKISPGSQIDIRSHILRETARRGPSALFELAYYYPGHPFVWAGVAALIETDDAGMIEWATKIAAQHGETPGGFLFELTKTAFNNGDAVQATDYLKKARAAGHDESVLSDFASRILESLKK
jgi:hypothetical protein